MTIELGKIKRHQEFRQRLISDAPDLNFLSGTKRFRTSPTNEKRAMDRILPTALFKEVEDNGLEPMTFWLPARRSPN